MFSKSSASMALCALRAVAVLAVLAQACAQTTPPTVSSLSGVQLVIRAASADLAHSSLQLRAVQLVFLLSDGALAG